jgi:pyruvate,water dikinase
VPWKPLRKFHDPAVPKLHNLMRAARAGIRIPETVWTTAKDGAPMVPPAEFDFPMILRSGSPTEDTHETSNAGQLLSLVVRKPSEYAKNLARVIAALPKDDSGAPRGVVFAQPLVRARRAGVAFFDGFYYERTLEGGGNEALTSGQSRGEVARGHLARGDAWSEWIARVHRVFEADAPRLDIELAEDETGYILLQARPALFAVARSQTLSLANHKEILGDPPSPWIASVVVEAGRTVLAFFEPIAPEIAAWDEAYAVMLGDRAWMSFSFFFRLMDALGLPRSFVTQGVGGEGGGPLDDRLLLFRFLRSAPRLVRLQLQSLRAVLAAPRALGDLDRAIESATAIDEVYRANVEAMGLAIRTNFAINGILSGLGRVRRALGIAGTARVVTEDMMQAHRALASLPTPEARAEGLREWLSTYGHRGPLESDPSRPRFEELAEVLRADLESTARSRSPEPPPPAARPAKGLFFWIDERREWFRDELMKRWRTLRRKALSAGRALADKGRLDAPEDVFFLHGDELEKLARDPSFDARAAVRAARARIEAARSQALPLTASRDAIERALASAAVERAAAEGKRVFPGIPLSPAVVEGPALKAFDLVELLSAKAGTGGIDPASILVVGALEPSWAVVFPRVRGVVAEIGGELSHASILLREAKKPAIVNAAGIFASVHDGDVLRLDGPNGTVEILR